MRNRLIKNYGHNSWAYSIKAKWRINIV